MDQGVYCSALLQAKRRVLVTEVNEDPVQSSLIISH